MRRINLLAIAILFVVFAPLGSAASVDDSAQDAPEVSAPELDAQALAAYRAEDFAVASELWQSAVDAGPGNARERARWMANLGNCAARQDDWTHAAAWFDASLRLRPRDAGTRKKLEFARNEAGWTPADRGDLASTTARVLGAFTEDEARWLALLGLLPLALALAGEALRGGRTWRRAIVVGLVLWAFSLAPCLHAQFTHGADPVVVVAESGAAARSEPRDSAERLERLESGTQWERVDALPDWTKLRGPGGRILWVPSADIFALDGSSQSRAVQ